MSCRNCTNGDGVPNGCKSNGSCGTGGCNKLEVYDWLADVDLPNGQKAYDIIEVRFKSSRKGFFHNQKDLQLQVGDAVVVEASPGFDIGVVSVVGELARIQVRKKAPNFKAHEGRKILRRASSEDLDKWRGFKEKEKTTMFRSRELASELALQMKISDVEYQGDGNKATFYYTAEDRVDFRQLIRDMADTFKIRVEMKQIGVRQEAARLGGIGSCGRELCCSTWLTDFRSVSTASARYQQLSLNPQKLAGQCGKLKCCLNYELDVYLDALKQFPSADVKLKTQKGTAFHVKTDVFKEEMWYIVKSDDDPLPGTLIPLTPVRVKEIIELNKNGKKPTDLKDFMLDIEVEEPDYANVIGQDSLNRFDDVFKRKKRKKKRKGGSQNRNKQNQHKAKNKGGGNQQNKKKGGQAQNKGKGGQGKHKGKKQNNPQGKGGNQNKKQGSNKNQNRRKGQGGKNNPQGKKQNQNQSQKKK